MDTRYTEYSLDTLDFDEAKLLFEKHFKKSSFTNEELKTLCEKVGYHTLTLELLAKTLQESFDLNTLLDLLEFLENKSLDARELQEEVFTNHSKEEVEIYTHLLQAFTLAGLEEDEKWLLLQFAVLPPIPHEANDILSWIKIEDKKTYGKLIKDLNKKGWLERKDNAFIMHRLVQTIIMHQEKPMYENCKNLVNSFEGLLTYDENKDNPVDNFKWIEYGLNLCENIQDNQSQIANLNDLAGRVLRIRGNYSEAVKSYQRSLSIEKILGNIANINILNSNLAIVYRNMGRNKEASELLEEALSFGIKELGKDHSHVSIYQCNLAIVYRNMGRNKEASELLETSLASDKKNFGENHPRVAMRQSNLANVYKDMDRNEEASELLELALDSAKKNLGEDHPLIATCQSNLGVVYKNLGKYKEALKFLETALASDIKNFGASNPNVAIDLINLAHVYLSSKEYEKSKKYFEKSYLIYLDNFGEDHPSTKAAKEGLGHTKQFLQ